MRFSLRSVEKNADWARKIFLVTNGQVPEWLDTSQTKLEVITHEQIFSNKSNLPTFNSNALEANLVNIPGLSEYFVYMNDDFFLGEKVFPSDFVCGDIQKIRLAWPLQSKRVSGGAPVRSPREIGSRRRKEDSFGESLAFTNQLLDERYFKKPRFVPSHSPYFFRKSILKEVIQTWPIQFEQTSANKFRTGEDILLALA